MELNDKTTWALKLFSKSPLKQKKYQMISLLLDKITYRDGLDIGADNGVISYLLRERGGSWFSADLIPETVASIKSLVGDKVVQIVDNCLPFADKSFDLVIVIDMLEHVQDDEAFLNEVFRVLRPEGYAILNVPNPKEGLMRKIQAKIGQTDAAHGHLRAGYTPKQLTQLISGKFELKVQYAYSRFFSIFIDTFITFILDRLKKNGRGKKGTVITKNDLNKMKKSFKIFSLIYPFVALFVKLDNLIPFSHGNMLISLCKKADE